MKAASFRNRSRAIFAALCLCAFAWFATVAPAAPTASGAMDLLTAGNQRFVAGKANRGHAGAKYRQKLTEGQHPFATVVGCSDSRVPVELVFDQGFGDLFVVRMAGNVIDTNALGSVEYAVHHLHTPLIVVMGHEGCGAVTSALLPAEDRAQEAKAIQDLLNEIEPALKGLDPQLAPAERLHQGIEANVRQSVQELQASSDLMQPHEGAAPTVVGAVYDLATGKVRFLK